MLQRQSQSQRLQQRADPQLLQTNRILQMSSLELRQYVQEELSENPALEAAEGGDCGGCDDPASRCASCPLAGVSRLLASPAEASASLTLPSAVEPEVDPFARMEATQSLQEYLLQQLRTQTEGAQDWRIGCYLVANIDEDGYLRCAVEEAAQSHRVAPEVVERILAVIQTLDPTGVGARSLQECLLVQARSLQAEGKAPPLLLSLLDEHWKETTASKWSAIARRLRVEVRDVEWTSDWLRRNLSPYPGRQHRSDWSDRANRSTWVRPDVLVTLNELNELELELPREETTGLQINPQYSRLWSQMRERPDAFSAAERKHLGDYLTRAQMVLKSLRDRTSILRQVTENLVEEQERYFRTEREEDMMPLTQSQLASFLHVHESTVSRAVADKYLQLPSGRVVPLSYFFDRALSQRALVANVVAAENPAAPYSDQQIADILRRQGVTLARRTVMKYREEMNILSSRQRGRPIRS